MPYDLENRRPPVPTQIPKVVNVKDPVKAMIKALTEGNIWAMSMLLVRGCSVDMLLDEEGTTPLIYLCSRTKALRPEDNDAIRFLISEGCLLDTVNHVGQTACILASMNGHTDAVNSLLTYRGGCDISVTDKSQMTAFLYASLRGHVDILQILKDHGADLRAPNGQGVEPALLAAMNGHNSALGWFDSIGRIRMKDEHFTALAQSTLTQDASAHSTLVHSV